MVYVTKFVKINIFRYRLVRHSWNLTVQESISVDVSLQESHNATKVEELVMAIKATNLNKVHSSISTEITLLNVGVLSKYWKLSKNIVTPKYINLNTQESAHILLKSRRVEQNKSVFSLISLFNSDRKHIQHLNVACLSFAVKAEQYYYNILSDQGNSDKDIFKEGLLFLQWQASVTDANSKKIVYGQNLLPLEVNRYNSNQITKEVDAVVVNINDKGTEKSEQYEKMLQKQVVYNLQYKSNITHDFNKNKLCIIPVELILHSVTEDEVDVTINTVDAW